MSQRESLRTAGLWALLLACLGGWVMPQVSIDYRRARWSEPEALLFLPTGQYLNAASLGFQAALADALYLWSIQYYGHHRSEEGRQYLWRIYDVITDLDPRYQDAYLTGALVMAVDMGDAELALRLLDKGAEANPDDWIYLVEAGHYAWISLDDYVRAAGYFDRALEIPGTPPLLGRIRAGMAELSGDRHAALALWVDLHGRAVTTGDEEIAATSWQHVYDLKIELDLEDLHRAVARFRGDRGRPPRVLDALESQGYMVSVPSSPTGEPYIYDPVTGTVSDPREGSSRAGR